MPVIEPQQTAFTAGEISPYMFSRIDIAQYNNSAREVTNFFVRAQGGLLKRPGTVFVAEIANSANDAILLPFIYSDTDAYMLEVGSGYTRFYRDGGQILSTAAFENIDFGTGDLTGWVNLCTGTGTALYSSSNSGSCVLDGGTSGVGVLGQAIAYFGTMPYALVVNVYTEPVVFSIGTSQGDTSIYSATLAVGAHTIPFTLTQAGTLYFQAANASNNSAYFRIASLSTPIYQLQNPYEQDELASLRWAQSYDTLYLCQENHPQLLMTRAGHAQWGIGAIAFTDGPYYNITDPQYGGIGSSITVEMSGITINTTVTATASSALFLSTDVGRFIRWRSIDTDPWGWGIITAVSSSTSASVSIQNSFDAASTPSLQWRLGYWSGTTGYPSVMTLYQQRTWFGNSTTRQQEIWASVTGDLYNMQPDDENFMDNVVDTSAMVYNIADARANIITGLVAQQFFFAVTSGGASIIDSTAEQGGTITPSTLYIRSVVSEPSALAAPLITRTSVLYPHAYGIKLLEITYNWAANIYIPVDLAMLAEQRTINQMQQIVCQTCPNYLIWAMLGDGSLSACTYDKEQNINGWHGHVLGGSYNGGNPFVNSIGVIPAATEDQVWFIVKRTVNGETVQYIEYLSPNFLIGQDVTTSNFLDCGSSYTGASTTTISGITWLEGQTVQCFGNGGVIPVLTPVTDGAITLQTATTQCVVGLPYTSTLETQCPNVTIPGQGSTHGRLGRITDVVYQVYQSYGGQIGSGGNLMDILTEYSDNTIMLNPITLQSGVFQVTLDSNFQRDPTVFFTHSLPVPCYITGLVYKINFKDTI